MQYCRQTYVSCHFRTPGSLRESRKLQDDDCPLSHSLSFSLQQCRFGFWISRCIFYIHSLLICSWLRPISELGAARGCVTHSFLGRLLSGGMNRLPTQKKGTKFTVIVLGENGIGRLEVMTVRPPRHPGHEDVCKLAAIWQTARGVRVHHV
jgi:hypothetical protein